VFQFLTRRDLFRSGSLLAAPALLRGGRAPASGPGLTAGANIYESIGVRPIINCRGTLTIIGGSLELPEVRAATQAASQHYVQLDELMDAIGQRLAELTSAEWGVVTSGCAAGLAHATAACVAGGNPDLHVRIPNLAGFSKDEVIIPKHSRNVYDAAVRSIGVKIIEVNSPEELEAALGPRVAMIYFFANERNASGPMDLEHIADAAKKRNVPVLVDAAAEVLTVPNVHLQRGATLVGYSGGKVLRGPQCAGIILGRKDLVQAAWVNSAPHHGYGRAMKVGKEEAMGMLMAVEMWAKRDHDAEWKQWSSWLDHISKRVCAVPGVTADVHEPQGLSNRSPGLSIHWDTAKLGITGAEVSEILYNSEPRIALNAGGDRRSKSGSPTQTGVSITAYMMSPGDEKVVADRLHAVLSQSHPPKNTEQPKPPAADLTGQWNVHIDFVSGSAEHTLYLKQQNNQIVGSHQGDFVTRDAFGTIDGDAVKISSSVVESQHGDALSYGFTGTVTGDEMSGDLDLGEYRKARWSARRHQYGMRTRA
jgi:D-glucosaminate-6-phosphate ammonia-lyase